MRYIDRDYFSNIFVDSQVLDTCSECGQDGEVLRMNNFVAKCSSCDHTIKAQDSYLDAMIIWNKAQRGLLGSQITTQHGLLYKGEVLVRLPHADKLANEHGYVYAENMVKALEKA